VSSNAITLLVLVVAFAGMIAFTSRARRRQAAQAEAQAAAITVGSEVMTTSGLYGTVVARNADDSVMLAIAPGVEVKWALAALRDVSSLPARYQPPGREPAHEDESDGHPAES
jgi:preprotein translocase subunit YajC